MLSIQITTTMPPLFSLTWLCPQYYCPSRFSHKGIESFSFYASWIFNHIGLSPSFCISSSNISWLLIVFNQIILYIYLCINMFPDLYERASLEEQPIDNVTMWLKRFPNQYQPNGCMCWSTSSWGAQSTRWLHRTQSTTFSQKIKDPSSMLQLYYNNLFGQFHEMLQ